MISSEPIRPLNEVWLRPRRVFRYLAQQPLGVTDYVLAAAQGIATYLALFRAQAADLHIGTWDIIASSLRIGPIAGVLSVFLFSVVYGRLGARAGGTVRRAPVFHVLAYGGLPVVATLLLWIATAALIGEAAFREAPAANADAFVWFVSRVQSFGYALLLLWSVVLQVMGFSEIQGIATRKAFGVWLLGQLFGILAASLLLLLIAFLFPGSMPSPPP